MHTVQCSVYPKSMNDLAQPTQTRRYFLSTKRIFSLGTRILFLFLATLTFAGCGSNVFSSLQIGTTIQITLFDKRLNANAWDSIRDSIDEYDRIFSSYPGGPDSYIRSLNTSAGIEPIVLHPEALALLRVAKDISLETNNAFALGIDPLVSLWGIGTSTARLPSSEEIENALTLIDPRQIEISHETAFLKKKGMGVDLGGIAKGYIAEQIAEQLKEMDVTRALLDFGGNIVSIGKKEDGSPWRVGIQDPRGGPRDIMGVYEITADTAVVTSGDYERFFEEDGVRYHHVLDSATGYPSDSDLVSTTIISADAVLADALSTASLVLGSQMGAELQSIYPNIHIVFISKDLSVWTSNPDSFSLIDDSFTLRDWSELEQ